MVYRILVKLTNIVCFMSFQVVIQSGQPPTVLQQLCSLPFQYFSDPRLVNVLFPTLISCCYSNQANREILEQELSCVLLSNFIEVCIFSSLILRLVYFIVFICFSKICRAFNCPQFCFCPFAVVLKTAFTTCQSLIF